MVSKKVLQKLSDKELKLYLVPTSRYVADAIQIAYVILLERGEIFTESEKLRIASLIKNRAQEEIQKDIDREEDEKDYLTDDSTAIALYPRALIIAFAFLLGCFPASILLALNLYKLKEKKNAIGVIFFGICFTVLQYFVVPFLNEIKTGNGIGRYKSNPEFLFAVLGALIMYFLWNEFIPKKMPYQSDKIIVPALLALIFGILIYFNYLGMFSSVVLVKFAL
jgi:hypothetical protein